MVIRVISVSRVIRDIPFIRVIITHPNTHTHSHTYVCVCMCVNELVRERVGV